jgi:hypothetical protein
MERAPSRIGFGLAVSLALLGIGSCAGGGRHPNTSSDCETAQDHFINVHGNSLSCDQARIAISKGHQVCWRSDRGTSLEIEFEDPSPFPDLRCHKNSCMSGAPDPNVLGSAEEREFKYYANVKPPTEYALSTTAQPTPTPTHSPGLYGRIIVKK